MKTPLISVIVPVYNKEKYVAKLIDCIKAQVFRNFECLIIDDGSTDRSRIICDELTRGDEVFSVTHIENGGVSHARNTALDMAKGEYITFVDSDDELPADYLQKIADDIQAYHPDMVIGAIKNVFDTETQIVDYPFEERVYTMQELLPQFAEAQKDCGVFGWCVNKTFKRESAKECRFDEALKLAEDFDYFLKVYPNIQTIYFDLHNYYSYLFERGEMTATKDSQIDYLSQAKIQIRFKKFLENSGSWSGNNRTIVTRRIQDYLYFTVFHSREDCFDTQFKETHRLFLLSEVSITESIIFRKRVLKCISKDRSKQCKALILLRRKASGIKSSL